MPVKHEEAKPELPVPAPPPASGISADALNRLIAMGGPAGEFAYHAGCTIGMM